MARQRSRSYRGKAHLIQYSVENPLDALSCVLEAAGASGDAAFAVQSCRVGGHEPTTQGIVNATVLELFVGAPEGELPVPKWCQGRGKRGENEEATAATFCAAITYVADSYVWCGIPGNEGQLSGLRGALTS